MIVTTGFFDGVHLGHRLVIERLVALAHGRDDESAVVTFWPHPRTVLQDGARELRLLTSLDEKKALLEGLGVDHVEVLDFTRSFAALTAEEYLRDVLQARFGATVLLIGYDNRLGSDRLTAAALAPAADRLGLGLVTLPPLGAGEQDGAISSTRIRTALARGEVDRAAAMLGYPYSLYGVVVAGNRLGRTIGFPTANMQLYEPLKLVPGNGAYAVDVDVLGCRWSGMCNIGVRPTVGGTARTIETHILDFSEDIYGLPIRITFRRKIRDEIHFPSLDALRDRLELDRRSLGAEASPDIHPHER
ncbi:MAG: riboflavin biosynthesis protein RibF [Bacteroidales bacterium]|nr:riboflavin biosynthesis protein RibF [Bacteroidales bacterium]